MGPQDPKDVTRDTARDLSGMTGELAALKADARHWLTSPGYAAPYGSGLKRRMRRSRQRWWRRGGG